MADSTGSRTTEDKTGKRGAFDFRLGMEQFYEDTVKPIETKPCSGVRQDLKDCILASSCVTEHKLSPSECLRLKPDDPLCPSECMAFKQTFFDCKRSLLDARQRFRGRKGY